MKCPNCGIELTGSTWQCLDSRLRANGIRRRRRCLVCRTKFSTLEEIVPEGKPVKSIMRLRRDESEKLRGMALEVARHAAKLAKALSEPMEPDENPAPAMLEGLSL